jgi:hypothetical protein
VLPYVAIYRRAKGDGAVSIVRIVHGRRNITRNLVPGGAMPKVVRGGERAAPLL